MRIRAKIATNEVPSIQYEEDGKMSLIVFHISQIKLSVQISEMGTRQTDETIENKIGNGTILLRSNQPIFRNE